jgi:protein arginine kinase
MEEYIKTIVTSTRIRLARNFSAYPFPAKLNESLAREIIYLVEHSLAKLDSFQKYNIADLNPEEAKLLQEQHLISPALIKNKNIAAVFISSDRDMSIMVNEEDHLRQQYIRKGLALVPAYERISGVDEALSSVLSFAYDDNLGYLTACPSNLGTGMRASVMMFLPGLTWSKEIENLLPRLKANGLTMRGVFGEGTAAEGYSYQVSNERTLGMSERELLEEVDRITNLISDMENRARERMLKKDKIKLKDACLRAYGALTNCAVLPLAELTEGIVKVKLGMALGFFESNKIELFNNFLEDMRPASFRLRNCMQSATTQECDIMRAEIVGNVLPKLVLRVE